MAYRRKLAEKFEKKIFKIVPPLKDYPEEYESDDSNMSDKPEVLEKARVFAFDLGRFEDVWREFPGDYDAMK